MKKTAFTLIELLIVVAIIGILAAIAVPNFLNAQLKAKIARVESELRNMGTALEMYQMDNNMYPVFLTFDGGNIWPVSARLNPLTTPIAYMSSIGQDPFLETIGGETIVEQSHPAYDSYDYVDAWSVYNTLGNQTLGASFRCSQWRIASAGPDGLQSFGNVVTYNATNGLNSVGDITRVGPSVSRPCDDSLVGK